MRSSDCRSVTAAFIISYSSISDCSRHKIYISFDRCGLYRVCRVFNRKMVCSLLSVRCSQPQNCTQGATAKKQKPKERRKKTPFLSLSSRRLSFIGPRSTTASQKIRPQQQKKKCGGKIKSNKFHFQWECEKKKFVSNSMTVSLWLE